jgi:L-alanine-DL-glutamate epimerase-like enolase superfamily enzyme
MKLLSLSVQHLRLPLAKGRVSLAAASSSMLEVLLVQIQTDSNHHGLGFSVYPTPGLCAAARLLIESELAPLLIGHDPRLNEKHLARVKTQFKSSEFLGLTARAYAPIDIALWDVKAKAQELPLWQHLGAARPAAKAFVSDLGLLSVELNDVPKAMKPLLDQGAIGLLAEIGSGSVEADAERIHDLRHAIGDSAWLGITARESFDLTTALGLAQYLQEEMEIDWFEEPISLDDRTGNLHLSQKLEVPLILGASLPRPEAFRSLLEVGIPRVLRADMARLGGITPWLKVALLAEAFQLSICPVRLTEVGIHLGCGLPNVLQIDYLSGLSPLFEEPLKFKDGFLIPPASPGLGLSVSEKALSKFRVG